MNFRISEKASLKRVTFALPFLALILIAVLLWLPFGLHISFYADDWLVFASIQAGKLLGGGLRPFLLFPWFVAYHLDPNSFVGINLFLWFLIACKGILFYLILCDLDFDRLFAFGTAALLLLYPADSGVFYMGGLTIHETIFTFLLSVWLVIRFWKTGRLWLWLPIGLSAALCLGSYEAVFPLFVIVPAILVYMQRRISRRVVVVSAVWFVMPILFGLRGLFTIVTTSSMFTYQQSIAANDRSVGAIIGSIWRAVRFSLVDSWVSAFSQTVAPSGWNGFRNSLKNALNNPYLVYALIAALVLVMTLVIIRKYSPAIRVSTGRYLWVALAGIVLIVLAFLPYTLSSLRDSNMRTFLHASQGAALTLSTCLWLVGSLLRRIKFVYATLLTALVVVGMTSLLYQHSSYVVHGQQQVPFMQRFVQTAPQLTPNSTIVVVDETPNRQLASTFNQFSSYLEGMTQIIYSDPTLRGIICYPGDNKPWGYENETCHFDANGVTLSNVGSPDQSWGYDRLVVFRYNTQDGLRLVHDISPYSTSAEAQQFYSPDTHINTTDGFPLRAISMLGLKP